MHDRACAFFQAQLRRPEAAYAREYLTTRGLNDETISRFRIGFAPESGFLLRDVLRGQFNHELLKASGLFSWKDHEDEHAKAKLALYSKFRNRVMFPITNEAGKIIAFTGRTLDANEKAGPKYLNSPETAIYSKSRVLFNLDQAKEAIRKLDYAILVEGQMDCISVYAAGFHNVIASSGTAFTDSQARLLARFSKNIVVNFDPDTAGAAATERSLGMLVAEDFQVRVATLEAGFDPDLFIRQKGSDAYAIALKNSEKYFDYLIARARAQFPVKSPEGKVKAVNYLLPHIQRVPSRIARDELAREMAQKLGIDSAVLQQELRHAATQRTGSQLKAPPEAQVTDAERILIRALTWGGEWQAAEIHHSSREGTDVEFDPARQAKFSLIADRLHEGLATESLIEALLSLENGTGDPLGLPISDADRQLLAGILMREEEELTPELLEGAIEALHRRGLERRRRDLQRQIAEAERKQDLTALGGLLQEIQKLDRALAYIPEMGRVKAG